MIPRPGVVALLDMDEKAWCPSSHEWIPPLLRGERKEFPSIPNDLQITGGLNERVAGVSPYTTFGEFERG